MGGSLRPVSLGGNRLEFLCASHDSYCLLFLREEYSPFTRQRGLARHPWAFRRKQHGGSPGGPGRDDCLAGRGGHFTGCDSTYDSGKPGGTGWRGDILHAGAIRDGCLYRAFCHQCVPGHRKGHQEAQRSECIPGAFVPGFHSNRRPDHVHSEDQRQYGRIHGRKFHSHDDLDRSCR